MKKIISRVFVSAMIIGALVFCNNIYADQPPDPGGEPTNGTPVGGSPIGSGLAILLSLGAAYGGKKFYESKK